MIDDLAAAAKRHGVAFYANSVGGMFGLYFAARIPDSYDAVMATDKAAFNRFFHAMLDAGVFLAPRRTKRASSPRHTPRGHRRDLARRRFIAFRASSAMTALVSIVTRTLGRPCVADATASVAARTIARSNGSWSTPREAVSTSPAGDVPVRVASAGEPPSRAPRASGSTRRRRARADPRRRRRSRRTRERLSAALDGPAMPPRTTACARWRRTTARSRTSASGIRAAGRAAQSVPDSRRDGRPRVRARGRRPLRRKPRLVRGLAILARPTRPHALRAFPRRSGPIDPPVGVGDRDIDGERGDARSCAARRGAGASAERLCAPHAPRCAQRGRGAQRAGFRKRRRVGRSSSGLSLRRGTAVAYAALTCARATHALRVVDSGLALLPYEPALHRARRRPWTGRRPERRRRASPGPKDSDPRPGFAL